MDRRTWAKMTLIVAMLTSCVLAFVPVIETETCATELGAGLVCRSHSSTLLDSDGLGALVLLAFATLVAAAPYRWPSRRSHVTTAWLLTLVVVVGIASVGLYFVPAAAAAWMAARSPATPSAPPLRVRRNPPETERAATPPE